MCKRVERICQVDPEGWYAPVIGQELVRCKDCQHWYEEDHVCGLRDCYGWDYKPDSFCSWAERKETE